MGQVYHEAFFRGNSNVRRRVALFRRFPFDRSCVEIVCFVLSNVMSTVHEILDAMDKLTREELRILKLGVDSRLADDDNDPALLASLKDAIAYADTHPAEARSIDEVRALIPQWISESKSQARP
jgi:hypothetical protein